MHSLLTVSDVVSLYPASTHAVDPWCLVNQHQSHRRKLVDCWRHRHRTDDSVELVSIFTRLFSGMSRISARCVHSATWRVSLRTPARKRCHRRGGQHRNSVYGFHKGEVYERPLPLLPPSIAPSRADKGRLSCRTPPG